MIRILLADDHAILRKGLKQLFELTDDLKVTCEASNGAEVLHLLQMHEFDLLLLDMAMEGLSGAELIGQVSAMKPALPILVLSMHKIPQLAVLALKAGADGYITKDSDPEMLLYGIRKVAAGGKYISQILSEEIAFSTSFPDRAMQHGKLSSREYEVFRLLASGLSNNEIAEQLIISNKTVSTYKTRIMEKMNFQNMAALIRYATLDIDK
jgi:DNA-binding NarL/FixJ family response regulator